jgi:hypothetical protein
MSQQRVEKKVVSRTVAISLGIICIVLAVGLVGAITDYSSIINGKSNTISSLNAQLTDRDSQISSLNNDKTSLQNQVSDLQTQASNLTNILNLGESTVWLNTRNLSQTAGSYTSLNFTVRYAGYITIYLYTSTAPTTYVRVTYSSHLSDFPMLDFNYDNQTDVGNGGYPIFVPVFPSSGTLYPAITVQIRVGTTNLIAATEGITITYHY